MLTLAPGFTAEPIVFQPNLYVNGFQIEVGSNTTLWVWPGICRDSTNQFDLTLESVSSTQPYTILNTTVNGPNGFDNSNHAGIFPDVGLYVAVFIIGDSRGFKPTATIATMHTFGGGGAYNSMYIPIMPTGYDIYRRIGWGITDANASGFSQLYQSGNSNTRTYQFDIPASTGIGSLTQAFDTVYNTQALPPFQDARVFLNTQSLVYTPGPFVTFNGVFTPNTAGNKLSIGAPGRHSTVALSTAELQVTAPVVSQPMYFGSQRIQLGCYNTVDGGVIAAYAATTSASDTSTVNISNFEDYI